MGFVKKQGQVRLDLADLSLSLAQEYSSVIGSDLTMKTVLLLLIAVSSVVARERNINMDQLKGMRKLLKQLDSGVFTTCNIVFFKELVPYDVADNNCKEFDIGSGRAEKGNLVTVNDNGKNDDLKLLLEMAYPKKEQDSNRWADTRWVWAGLRKTKNNELKKPGKYNALDWEWADGSNPETYFKWMNWGKKNEQPDQRTLVEGNQGCDESPRCYQNQMRINHEGEWDDTWKFKTHPYACDYQGKYVLSNIHKTWNEAKVMCEQAGLHVAKIRNAEEVAEMKSAMTYFLGPADEAWERWDKRNWIWTGGNDIAEEGPWKWLDDTLVDTTSDWFVWTRKAGGDNARRNQHGLSFSRGGEFDDSFHQKKNRARGFACQCPGS